MSTIPCPNIAKARLLTLALNAASRARLSATTHAVLAHLITDAWPDGNGWTARTPQTTLATRLDCSPKTIIRSVQELAAAEIVNYAPGRGSRRSRFNIRSVWTPTGGLSPHPRGEVPPPVSIPTPHPRGVYQEQVLLSSSSSPEPAPAAAIYTWKKEEMDERIRFLHRRPEWLPEKKPWIDLDTARSLAQLPLEQEAVDTIMREAQDARHTLKNPAGFVIARLRRHGLAHVEEATA